MDKILDQIQHPLFIMKKITIFLFIHRFFIIQSSFFKITITMEKTNLNVIIFDEDESSIKHQKQYRTVNSSKHNQHNENQQYEIIEQEIHYLSEKIKNLEQQADNQFLLKNQSNAMNKPSSMVDCSHQQTQNIQFAIQKKIQIIIKETRKIVQKLSQTFEKKLQQKLQKKYTESGLNKIKENYGNSIKKIEEFYKKQTDRVSLDHKQVQNKMLIKVSQIEQKLMNRINEFQIKEKEYIDWIHHLEIKIQDFQNQEKTTKVVENTQDKFHQKESQSNYSETVKNNENSYSNINQNKRVSPSPNDSSKIQRKHRIFGDNNRGASISSNNKVTNNNKSNQSNLNANYNSNFYQNNSNLINKNVQTNPVFSSKVINPNFKIKNALQPTINEQKVTISLATRSTQPLRQNFTGNEESSPWKVIDKSIERSNVDITKRNKVVEDIKEDSFYKDVPKVSQGWQKFQDFKEIEASSSQSQEDVLFYREGDRHQQFLENFRSSKYNQQENLPKNQKKQPTKGPVQGQQKFFSPFDLN